MNLAAVYTRLGERWDEVKAVSQKAAAQKVESLFTHMMLYQVAFLQDDEAERCAGGRIGARQRGGICHASPPRPRLRRTGERWSSPGAHPRGGEHGASQEPEAVRKHHTHVRRSP
mgnify:CR=1 FL=1